MDERPANAPIGWYSGGYLPHRDHPGLLQTITYRLADSLPDAELHRIDDELRLVPADRQDAARRQRMEDWLDAGHGSCLLRHASAAECVIDTWRRFAGERYDLIAWVVMPNHVHVLIRVYDGQSLGKIVQSWKSYTARRIGEMKLPGSADSQFGTGGGIWMREYWDRYIRDNAHFAAAVNYIHQNPVKAKLVSTAGDFVWSSAREYGQA